MSVVFKNTAITATSRLSRLNLWCGACGQECTQTSGDVVLHMFDPVTVQVSIDKSNIQHQRLMLKLVVPHVSCFSPVLKLHWNYTFQS